MRAVANPLAKVADGAFSDIGFVSGGKKRNFCRLLAATLAASVLAPLAAFAQNKGDEGPRYTPTPPVSYPGGVQNLRDITYAELNGFRPLKLDLYLPPGSGAAKPVVVFIHGGAWRHRDPRDGGVMRDFPAVLASVAARGYVVAGVSYRFIGETHFPGAVQDVGMAIRWLRMHASQFNLDPTRFVAWGTSAGGQIASLIGTGCGAPAVEPPPPENIAANQRAALPSACVQAVVDWYGVTDLESFAADLGKANVPGANQLNEDYLGCELPKCAPGFARSASPLAYVDGKDPPFLIQHGTADVTVSAKQSQKLYDALRAAGVPAEIVFYENVSHGFAKVPGGGPDEAVNKRALEKLVEFLAQVTSARDPASASRPAPSAGTR
jgi:acetyl esterase/lipase